MNSKVKKIIFTTLAFLIVFNFWKAMNPDSSEEINEEVNEEVVKTVKEKAPTQEAKVTEVKAITPAEPSSLIDAYKEYKSKYLPLAQERDIKCSQAADELFKNPSFIDIEDPFYKDPMNVISLLHDVYVKTLVRTEVVSAYVSLSSIVKNDLYKEASVTPSEYRNQAGLLEYYCRPEMSLRYIETVMEANVRYNFSPRMKKDIFDMSIGMLESVIGEMYTTNNLIYGLGFFKLLIDHKMLQKEAGDEIVPLFDKVLEHHKGFTNTWQRDKEAGAKKELWPLLKEDLDRRNEFGSEFKEVLQQMKNRYHSR